MSLTKVKAIQRDNGVLRNARVCYVLSRSFGRAQPVRVRLMSVLRSVGPSISYWKGSLERLESNRRTTKVLFGAGRRSSGSKTNARGVSKRCSSPNLAFRSERDGGCSGRCPRGRLAAGWMQTRSSERERILNDCRRLQRCSSYHHVVDVTFGSLTSQKVHKEEIASLS